MNAARSDYWTRMWMRECVTVCKTAAQDLGVNVLSVRKQESSHPKHSQHRQRRRNLFEYHKAEPVSFNTDRQRRPLWIPTDQSLNEIIPSQERVGWTDRIHISTAQHRMESIALLPCLSAILASERHKPAFPLSAFPLSGKIILTHTWSHKDRPTPPSSS